MGNLFEKYGMIDPIKPDNELTPEQLKKRQENEKRAKELEAKRQEEQKEEERKRREREEKKRKNRSSYIPLGKEEEKSEKKKGRERTSLDNVAGWKLKNIVKKVGDFVEENYGPDKYEK